MKKTGAWLVRFALEQIGIQYTFGIPGVHNTELYDELHRSKQITPVLVTHECGGAFTADAISRTSDQIGTLITVPAAGITHAASGIGEAFLDGIPMLVISGGIRRDTDNHYQLHDIDQQSLLKPITKATYLIRSHEEIIPTLYEAYHTAITGEPGPVFVEVPVDIQLFTGEVFTLPAFESQIDSSEVDVEAIRRAAEMLLAAEKPGLFLGWGAVSATHMSVAIADFLNAPVATTLQGLSAFPANHPLHCGMGFGEAAVPAAEEAFQDCDCMLAVGTRFSEIATGSYGVQPPTNLIHADINPAVFSKNYPAEISIQGDSKIVLSALLKSLQSLSAPSQKNIPIRKTIKSHKESYLQEWFAHKSSKGVNPARFFCSLREKLNDDAIVVCDDGNHTFLTAELMPIYQAKGFISPTDFNSMGYCVPATNGAKLANPDKQVIGIVGDGAFLMTCMETLTAKQLNLGVIYFIFNDGELAQIAQAQEIPYNRKTCTTLPSINIEAMAMATGCSYISIHSNSDVDGAIQLALTTSKKNIPVIVNIQIDYSKKTRFTKGVVKANLKRFDLNAKSRFIGRALVRRVTG